MERLIFDLILQKKQTMKKLTLLLLTLTFVSCYQVEHNCKDFKTGKFEFKQEINGKQTTSTFERTQNLQIETFNGKTDTASVRWVNDCEFVLEKLHPKNMKEKKAINQVKAYSGVRREKVFSFRFSSVTTRQ